jgi:site-specific recombinase XerD
MVTFSRYALRENFEDALALCSEIERIPKMRTVARPEAVHMTREEMSILLRLPDTNYKVGQRDKVILSTLYATGARAQELCDITVGDIRFGETTTVTLHGKGGKTRVVVIPARCSELLKTHLSRNFLNCPDIDKRRHVFSSQTHEHMTISGLEAIIRKYVTNAKELRADLFRHNYTPHSFRHSIAMHMLESGIPLPVIKTFLGHVSIATTMIYASANFELVSKYLRDKDPYADQDKEMPVDGPTLSIPQFLR